MMVLCAQIVPVQVIVLPMYQMMVEWGWVDTYRGLILPVAISPFIIFFLKQSFMQIPRALDEAAMIDGCSRIGVLFRVIPVSYTHLDVYQRQVTAEIIVEQPLGNEETDDG